MPPQVSPTALAQKLKEQADADAKGLEASATILPGPTRAAFSMVPDIKVGPYKVRRFLDGDLDTLASMEHPFGKIIEKRMAGIDDDSTNWLPRGKWGWILCWMMTRDIDEVDKVIADGGIEAVTEAAKKEFRKSTFGDIGAIALAVIEQFNIYQAPIIGYGPSDEKDEGEKSRPPQ